jgi:hypothetical protein
MNPEQFRQMLARKLGPMPVGAWLAVVAVGVAVTAAVIRHRRAAMMSAAPATSTAAAKTGPFTPGGFTVSGTGAGPGTGSTLPISPVDSGPTPEPETNDTWSTKAIRWAIAKGFTPSVATSAIGKALTGEGLTAQEMALLDAALVANGPPPAGMPPPALVAGPTQDASVPGAAATFPASIIVGGSRVATLPPTQSEVDLGFSNPYNYTQAELYQIIAAAAARGVTLGPAAAARKSPGDVAFRDGLVRQPGGGFA